MRVYVLDTHALLWWLEGNPKLSPTARQLLADINIDLYLPALVIAEMVDLILKRRTALQMNELVHALSSEARFKVEPLDQAIAISTGKFDMLADIHDRCVVATTLSLIESGIDAVLITLDRAIHESKAIPVAWS